MGPAVAETAPDTGARRPGAAVADRATRESLARLRVVREEFLADPAGTDLSRVRDVIARSWRRSVACNVNPEAISPELRDVQLDGPFLQIAMPVVERLENLARDTGVAVVLCDAAGTIAAMRGDKEILKWADSRYATVGSHMPEELTGTNSDGTALEEGASVQVWGAEHYAEGLQETFCSSVPVWDVLRRRIAAVLTLMVPEPIALSTDPGSLALVVEGAAAEISRSAAVRLAHREQALLQAYMRESRMRGAEAVLAIDERTTIASNRAQQILTPDDYAVVSGYAREAASQGGTLERMVSLPGDRAFKLTAKPVLADGDVVGAVVRVREKVEQAAAQPHRSTPSRAFGEMVGDSAAMSKVRTAASSALSARSVVCVTGEQGTGRAFLAGLMAQQRGGSVRFVECDPARRGNEQDLLEELRDAIASDAPVVALHVDQLAEDVAGAARELLRKVSVQRKLFVTAYQVPEDLLRGLAGAGVPEEVRMPPLRSRREDIPLLVAHFLTGAVADRPLKADGKLLHALTQAEWPGNVADLRDVVVSATRATHAGVLEISDLGELQQRAIARGRLSRLEAAELEQIRQALEEAHGNRVRAAEILEIGRSTLYRKIDTYTRRGFDLGA